MTARFHDHMTLGEAREKLRTLVDEGEKCPCCTQMAKVYRRKINSTMARTLIKMWRAGGAAEFVHTASLPGDTHEASQLSWWNLIEDEGTARPDGGRAGYWRIRPVGALFVRGETTVAQYARIYDGRVLSLVGKQVTIHDALGSRFNYRELMEGL